MFFRSGPQVVTPHLAALIKNDNVVTELELFFSTMSVLLSVHPREPGVLTDPLETDVRIGQAGPGRY